MKKSNHLSSKKKKENRIEEGWKKRIINERGYSESLLSQIVEKTKGLTNYMKNGYAVIAYHKQDGSFQLSIGTILPFYRVFGHSYEMWQMNGSILFWDIKTDSWKVFHLENLIDWEPIV